MDFASLPPEVNSALMYTGPGAGPMLAGAAGWQALTVALESAAGGYTSVVSGLAGQVWSGPTVALMTAAVMPYVQWLATTAGQAQHTAAQAYAAAAAYEAAFVATVPPPVIAANRAQLAALVATNFFGQNTPAIAATEAHYAEMWAQDAAAMYGYAAASAAASTLTPFSPPPQITNPVGQDTQANAVAQVTANTASVHTQSLVQVGSSNATHQLASTNAVAHTVNSAAGIDPPLPAGQTINVAPGGASIGQGVTVTVTPGNPVVTPGTDYNSFIAVTQVIWQRFVPGATPIVFPAGSEVGSGPQGVLSGIVSGTFINGIPGLQPSIFVVPSGTVTGTVGTVGGDVLVNSAGAVTAVESGSITTGATAVAPSASGWGAALPAAGGLAGTSGIQPQLNADLLLEWADGVATNLVGVPG